MRRPARKEDQFERRVDAARFVGVRGIARRGFREHAAWREARAGGERVSFAHLTQVAHQGERIGIADIAQGTVGDRQGEPGPLKKAAKVKSGAKTPSRETVGTVTAAQVKEIAEAKMKDLNANDVEAAMQIILGSARSMGIEVK